MTMGCCVGWVEGGMYPQLCALSGEMKGTIPAPAYAVWMRPMGTMSLPLFPAFSFWYKSLPKYLVGRSHTGTEEEA